MEMTPSPAAARNDLIFNPERHFVLAGVKWMALHEVRPGAARVISTETDSKDHNISV
jgi:hypothetical protein